MSVYISKFLFVLPFIILWLVFCISKYKKWSRRIKNCTQEVVVKVVDVLEKKTSRGAIIYKPIFEYLDSEKHFVIDSAFYSNLISFEVGDRVELLINPNNTKEFMYKNDSLNRGKFADIMGCCLQGVVLIGIIIAIIKS